MNSPADEAVIKGSQGIPKDSLARNNVKSKSLPLLKEKGDSDASSFISVDHLGSLHSHKEASATNNVTQFQSLQSSALSNSVKTKAKFGLFNCIGILTGSMVGMGILAGGPQSAYAHTNNALVSLVIWLLYGIVAIMGAFCYAELGTTLPMSGGDYTYINEIIGPFMGFLYQWSAVFVFLPAIEAIQAITIAQGMIAVYVDHDKCHPSLGYYWGRKCLAVAVIVAFSILNSLSQSVVSRLQGTLFILKLVAMASLLISGIIFIIRHGIFTYTDFTYHLTKYYYGGTSNYYTCHPRHTHPESQSDDDLEFTRDHALKIAMATCQVSFAYLGFNVLNFIADEVKDPRRNLSLAIMITMPIVVIVNIFINLIYFSTMKSETIINSELIVTDFAEAIIPKHIYKYTMWIAPSVVALAVIGSLNTSIISSARVPFMGARNKQIPQCLAFVSRNHSLPTPSITLMSFVSSFLVVVSSRRKLVELSAYLENGFMMVTISSLIYLRYTQPDLHRPIKLPLFIPVIFILVNAILFVTPILTIDSTGAAVETLPYIGTAGFILLTGIPVYLLLVKRKHQNPTILHCNDCNKDISPIFLEISKSIQRSSSLFLCVSTFRLMLLEVIEIGNLSLRKSGKLSFVQKESLATTLELAITSKKLKISK